MSMSSTRTVFYLTGLNRYKNRVARQNRMAEHLTSISYNDHDNFIVYVKQRGTHATTARSSYI
jgi:hypothetical protein